MAAKKCLICSSLFEGRADARTCSPRCRKRLQLLRLKLSKITAVIAFIITGFLLAIISSVPAVALAKGYSSADSSLQKGVVVKLRSESNGGQPVVERAQYTEADRVFGVVVELTDSLATEAPAGSQVYVESAGPAQAYVSDLNGEVKKGDLLTLSTLAGVLMRAEDRTVTTVGTALEDFSGQAQHSTTIKDSGGDSQETKLALLDINVNIVQPSAAAVSQTSNSLLDRLSSGLVGREINGLRVLAALAIFATLLVIEAEIIYGTITTSIAAVGRNPLAKSLIGRESLKSVSVGIIVLIVGTAAITVLLWA
jgi:hypothetical protein